MGFNKMYLPEVEELKKILIRERKPKIYRKMVRALSKA